MDLEATKQGVCTGCTACLYACPNSCISMHSDDEGFLYPVIDQEVCFNCNACNNICPAIKQRNEQKEPRVYAVVNKNDSVRDKSTSGGVFSALSNYVLDKGGVVYGAAFDDRWMVEHIRINHRENLWKLQGAKYLQSRLGNIYEAVQADLEQGRDVLFSGTPCQIDGLCAVLPKAYDNLLTCAVVCHGVPSPGVFEKYLTYVKDKVGEGFKRINFRAKQPSWRHYSLVFEGQSGGKYLSPVSKDPYMKGFINGLYMRPSCHNCPAKPSGADIVLGDYWGVEHIHPQLDDDRGTSVVIVNTKKGQKSYNTIVNDLKIEESTLEGAVTANPAIMHSAKSSAQRPAFFSDYKEHDFAYLYRKYLKPETRIQYIITMIKKLFQKG